MRLFSARLFSGLALLASAAVAGTITGSVSDPGGAGFSGAPVVAKNTASGQEFKATSAAKGEFTIANLPAGSYDISANVPGVRGFQKKEVAVDASGTVRVDIKLEEGTQLSTLGEDPLAIMHDNSRQPPSGATPRTSDGKPDLTGVWRRPRILDPGKPEWLPAADALFKQRSALNGKESPFAHCLPPDPTRLPAWFKIVQAPAALMWVLDDDMPGFRQYYMDGRAHPKDVNPTWFGHSVAKWEGDTLVVDRIGFNDRGWLDNAGHPRSEKLHIVEHYRRPDKGHLEIETTVDDPGVLAKPFTMKRVADLAPGDEEVLEFICTENNRDVDHLVGK